MLTTAEAAALLSERGVRVNDRAPTARTVQAWCRKLKFPGAIPPATKRGDWLIPIEDVETFEQWPNGRPRKTPRA